MNIKTTREIQRRPMIVCASVTHEQARLNKRWVAVDDLVEVIKSLQAQTGEIMITTELLLRLEK